MELVMQSGVMAQCDLECGKTMYDMDSVSTLFPIKHVPLDVRKERNGHVLNVEAKEHENHGRWTDYYTE